MMGSHLDSQPYGGRFDGTAGVLAGIEAVHTMTEQGILPQVPVHVVAFSDEEGWRFQKGLFGSRGLVGRLESGELERTDKHGITRAQALKDFGCNPERSQKSVYPPGKIGAYLELHIEQGPVLESLHQPLGIVTGIAGPSWLTVTLHGFAGHAGSVPMGLRQDALIGASETILGINRIAKSRAPAPTVATVGSLHVFPDTPNSIPEQVEFTIDLRDIDALRRNECQKEIMEFIAQVCAKYNLTYTIRQDMLEEPKYCTDWIMHILRESAKEMDLSLPELMSGPFHDAVIISSIADFAMIFVRCRNGISHNPAEFAASADLALGADLLYRGALRTINHISQLIPHS